MVFWLPWHQQKWTNVSHNTSTSVYICIGQTQNDIHLCSMQGEWMAIWLPWELQKVNKCQLQKSTQKHWWRYSLHNKLYLWKWQSDYHGNYKDGQLIILSMYPPEIKTVHMENINMNCIYLYSIHRKIQFSNHGNCTEGQIWVAVQCLLHKYASTRKHISGGSEHCWNYDMYRNGQTDGQTCIYV